MAPTAVHPTVTLTRDQADALMSILWELRGGNLEEAEELRLTRLSVHLFDAVEWQAEERQEAYNITVDPDIAWLTSAILPAEVDSCAGMLVQMLEDKAPPEEDRFFGPFVDVLLERQVRTTKAEAEQLAREYLGTEQQIAECQNFIAAAELLGGAADAELMVA